MAEGGWTAILDDALARKCARSFSLPYKGTLAIILMAKLRGSIPSAGDVVRLLKANGFRMDDETIRAALKQVADEEWPA
jgi:predicted nucleic acid-binding protein